MSELSGGGHPHWHHHNNTANARSPPNLEEKLGLLEEAEARLRNIIEHREEMHALHNSNGTLKRSGVFLGAVGHSGSRGEDRGPLDGFRGTQNSNSNSNSNFHSKFGLGSVDEM